MCNITTHIKMWQIQPSCSYHSGSKLSKRNLTILVLLILNHSLSESWSYKKLWRAFTYFIADNRTKRMSENRSLSSAGVTNWFLTKKKKITQVQHNLQLSFLQVNRREKAWNLPYSQTRKPLNLRITGDPVPVGFCSLFNYWVGLVIEAVLNSILKDGHVRLLSSPWRFLIRKVPYK